MSQGLYFAAVSLHGILPENRDYDRLDDFGIMKGASPMYNLAVKIPLFSKIVTVTDPLDGE